MARRRRLSNLEPPFLRRIWAIDQTAEDAPDKATYPFNMPLFADGMFDLTFEKPVTVFVGENGSGKSTLLEVIATLAGFSEGGGARGHVPVGQAHQSGDDGGALADHLRAAWLPKVANGFSFRAETFFSLLRYIDESGSEWGGHLRASHGEGFLSFFEERMGDQGVYIFDEPESALSPTRQFEFLKLLRRVERSGTSQIIMATHSPILMAYPGADLRQIDRDGIYPVRLEDTAHFRTYREFFRYPHETVAAMTE
jgi:predicted ATPase